MENIKYCYLDKVFTDVNDNSLLYQVTMSDSTFNKIFMAIVDREKLMEYATDSNIVKDFFVKEWSGSRNRSIGMGWILPM